MQRNNWYSFESRVRYSETNHERRLTLPGIINYFQDCSTFQTEALGVGFDYLERHGRGWVLSSWQVVVERYPKFTEKIQVSTWATAFKGVFGDRNFCIIGEDGKMAAYAGSLWVYMDMEKKRPVKPEPYEIEAYGTGAPLDMEYAPRKIKLPSRFTELPKIKVGQSQIDTNEHVNNCQYIQMAQEAVLEVTGEELKAREIRVEYKNSAVYKDIIVPHVAVEDGRTVAKLDNTEGKPYAVVEFKV